MAKCKLVISGCQNSDSNIRSQGILDPELMNLRLARIVNPKINDGQRLFSSHPT